MKKIILTLLSLLILVSCSAQEIVDNGKEDEIIIEIPNYDNLEYQTISEYNEDVNQNNNWHLEGIGEYYREGTIKTIKDIYGGDGNYENSILFSDTFILNKASYTVSFNINSDIDVNVRLVIGSSTRNYLDEYFDVSNGDNSYEYSFNGSLDGNTQVKFYLGNRSNESHSMEISGFNLSTTNGYIGTKINQIGYLPKLEKQVVFNTTPGDYFYVVNADNDEVVYTSLISEMKYENDSDEYLYKGFFKDVDKEGNYYIRSELGNCSYVFNISDSVFNELNDYALYFLYLQRCGTDINDELLDLSHAACHTSESKVWTTVEDKYIDVSGGWHDAGDYGRYLGTVNVTIADLLFTYLYSDNNSKDVLDEAKYGLDFIMKMQKSSGEVYNKVSSKEFSKFVSPENDNQETYVLWPWTLTTATSAGVLGLVYEIYKDSDVEYANKCKEAFNKAIDYVYLNTKTNNPMNPEEFNVGTYYDDDETEERLFAYSVAYRITKDDRYIEPINTILNNEIDGDNYRTLAYAILLDTFDYNSDIYNKVKELLTEECNNLSDSIKDNGYAYPMNYYGGMSNQLVCKYIAKLLIGARYLKDERYMVRASEAINYILGMNTLNMSFVYEFGYNYPHTIHSRLATSHGKTTIKGAMINGVNQYLSEGMVGQYFSEDSPIATRFVDNSESYTNVEPTIDYNSSLVLALSLLQYANNHPLQ